MKTRQLIEIENVKGANRVLKNLLERTRTENVGIGLFYGRAGLGKTRWSTKTAQENGYVYLRLEVNITPKDFVRDILSKLLHKTMPYYNVKGTLNECYNQVLDILQRDQNIVLVLDEIDYGFSNERILATVRDWADVRPDRI
jgi:Cdc6-like AAA superfamily ATPase